MASPAVASTATARSKIVEDKSLRQILDGLVISQRQDIKAYSGGHLNEANLPKPPDKMTYRTWKSAHKPGINMVSKGVIPSRRQDTSRNDTMNDTIWNFSIGTAGNVPMKRKTKAIKPSPPPSRDRGSHASHYSQKQDGVLVEELALPETMLVKTQYPDTKREGIDNRTIDKSIVREIVQEDTRAQSSEFQDVKLPPINNRHEFLPSHFGAVTKKDQFVKLKEFEETVLRKQDATEQNVMSGLKSVENLENKLQHHLENLPYNGYGPNFHRLQVYSNVFEDLIEQSTTFGFILETIKSEYDEYIASLLDGQTAKHTVLHQQIEQLTARGATNPQQLRQEVHVVHSMEKNAQLLLEDNERLRKELMNEQFLLNKPVEEDLTPQHFSIPPSKQQPDLMETIEEMKVEILERIDQMSELKTKLRKEYVPSTVCSHLEQCIKETEIQKLTGQKEFFERSINEMETELKGSIENADTTERDSKRVWKKIMAVKASDQTQVQRGPGAIIPTRGPGGPTSAGHRAFDSDDDSDPEDFRKWSWYIS